MKDLFCGIDLGGTTLNIGLVTTDGKIVIKENPPSNVRSGVKAVISQVTSTLERWRETTARGDNILGTGIGVAGLVDARRGVLKEATNFPGWDNVPLAAELSRVSKLPVAMDNDANVAALGEYLFGAGRGFDHMMMVTLGTGVGGGLILDGRIYRGAFGAAGEFGHITINKNGRMCACGRPGCVEAYVGTRGILTEVRENLADYPHSVLAGSDLETLTPKDIYTHAVEGDELALKVFQTVGENLGYGLGSVVNLLNLQGIVIGGGVALAGELLINSAQKKLDEMALNNSSNGPVRIVKAVLGKHAGLVGAASLAMASV